MIFVDSNVLIFASKPGYSHVAHLLSARDEEIACSEVVRLEVMGFPRITLEEKKRMKVFFDNILVYPVDRRVVDRAIEIRQKKAIEVADAMIAATALVTKKTLWTNNTKDFEWIEELNWYDPV